MPDLAGKQTHWLVDGFNVLHVGRLIKDPQHWWGPSERRSLILRATAIAGPDTFVWIVFDGTREATIEETFLPPAVRVVFAPCADDWLLKTVRTSNDPGSIAVVTADQPLSARTRHHGAKVVSPKTFLRHCGPVVENPEIPQI